MVYHAGVLQGLETDCVFVQFGGAFPFSSVYRPFTTKGSRAEAL